MVNGSPTTDWIDVPHAYEKDNLIVLYLGRDEAMLTLLETHLGQPFAEGPLP